MGVLISLGAPDSALAALATDGKEGSGFTVEAKISTDNKLLGNTAIIGAHLHTGDATTNGPVNIVYCGE